ncbi:MAG TPA: hypothetical protein ENK91_14795 [Bacteroidetes bacterium]|nr:hypothetical protein [Bacteroidota bacterium]
MSFEEDTYGKVLLYDYRFGNFDESYTEILSDNFEEFVNSLQAPKDENGYYNEIKYYCDEDLVY